VGDAIDIPAALGRSYLFAGLGDDELAALAAQVRVRTLVPGEHLCHRGDAANNVWVIVTGETKVITVDVDGDELIHFLQGPGMTGGEPGFFAPERERMVDVVAAQRTSFIRIERPTLESFLGCHPEVKDRIIEKMAQTWRWYAGALVSLAMRPLVDQIAARLLELADAEGRRTDGTLVTPRVSQTTLARMLGVSRENLNRALAQLIRDGSVRRDGGRYQLIGEPRLRARLGDDLPILPLPER
jgi:CRP-like cAMP-binding protein